MNEIWKDIPGYKGYYSVSNNGLVIRKERSFYRIDHLNCTNKKFIKINTKEKIMKNTINKCGYLVVSLKCPSDKKGKQFKIHRLVAIAFLGLKINDDRIVCHIDDIKTNNNLDNLYIGDNKSNYADMVRNGGQVIKRGTDSSFSKLSLDQIRIIRGINNITRDNILEMSKLFGVHECTIKRVFEYKTYKYEKV